MLVVLGSAVLGLLVAPGLAFQDGRLTGAIWPIPPAQGLFGVAICTAILLFLLVTVYFQPHGVQRALALFLVIYCPVASFTELGFTDASTYMLDLALAASVLMPAVARRSPA
jgi:hypothetical protein